MPLFPKLACNNCGHIFAVHIKGKECDVCKWLHNHAGKLDVCKKFVR